MSPAELTSLLPHRAPMLMLDALLAADAQGGRARLRVDPGAWCGDGEGAMPAWIGLELMAQTIAACRGQLHAGSGRTGAGYLVACRNYRSTVAAFPAGAELDIQVRLLEADCSGLCGFQCEILLQGQILAEASLKVIEHAA